MGTLTGAEVTRGYKAPTEEFIGTHRDPSRRIMTHKSAEFTTGDKAPTEESIGSHMDPEGAIGTHRDP
jgi:hypothetical protein